MKKKLSVRAAASLLLSALLFCMPIGALMRRKAAPEGKQRKAPEQRAAEKRRKALKQNPVTAAANQKEKRRAERYREMKFQSRNVPVKKNAYSILMIRIVRSARRITPNANM